MKIIKLFLTVFLVFISLSICAVVYQNQILYRLVKTENSEFKNIQYTIENSEIVFDDFILNGKSLGGGKAKVSFKLGGFLGVVPEVEIENLKLSSVDIDSIYNHNDIYIDTFIDKIKTLNINEEENKSEDISYSSIEIIEKIENDIYDLESKILNFVDNTLTEDLKSINDLKENYINESNYRLKSNKIKEITTSSQSLSNKIYEIIDIINKENKKIENSSYSLSKIVEKDLNNLAYLVELNSLENINEYIFIDNYNNIEQSLNKSLKIFELIKEIQSLDIVIKNLNIANNNLEIKDLYDVNNSTGHFTIDINGNDVIVSLHFNEKSGELNYKVNNLSFNIIKNNDSSLLTVLNYDKIDLFGDDEIKLVSEISYYDNNIVNTNKTQLSNEEEEMLINKINNIEQNTFNNINKNYDQSILELDKNIKKLNEISNILNEINKNLLVFNNVENINKLNELKEFVNFNSTRNLSFNENEEELTQNNSDN